MHAIPVAFSGTLLALAIFQNVKKKFFEKTIYLLKKVPILERFENLTNSVAFSGKFATLSDFQKTEEFFWKTHLSLIKNPNF